MSMNWKSLWVKASLTLVGVGSLGAVGCLGSVNPTDPKVAESEEGKICTGDDGLIDDGEDNNNATTFVAGRGGYWYTFVDDANSTVWPTAGAHGGTFEMSPGGADGSQFAARFKGKVAAAGAVVYAGMGMNFLDPKGPFDASKYGGISFWAKKGPGSTSKVRVKIPDKNTDKDAGICTECFNDFGMNLTLTSEWQRFIIPWFAMRQEPNWGRPKKMKIEPTTVSGIQFQVKEMGAEYDIYVDQIRFTGCK